ncbi:hypothetical protein Hanom_Chr03g00234811 [Helianthus anomalus]
MSLAHRKGGYDRLNLEWSAAMLNLCLNHKLNLSGLIFNYLIENVRGPTWAMYPRFIQMLINDQYENPPNDGDLYTFHVPTSRHYTEIKTNEWVLLHDWMYAAERLPLVKEAYIKNEKHFEKNNKELHKLKQRLLKRKNV